MAAIAMTLLVIEIPRPDASDLKVGNGVSKTKPFDGLWHFLTAQSAGRLPAVRDHDHGALWRAPWVQIAWALTGLLAKRAGRARHHPQ